MRRFARDQIAKLVLASTAALAGFADVAPAGAQGPSDASNRSGQASSPVGKGDDAAPEKSEPPKGNGASPKTETADTAPKPGILPFVPPYSVLIPNGDRFSLDTNGITLKTRDGDAKLRIGGRLEADGSSASLHPEILDPTLTDDFDFRRAWLEAYLTLFDAVELTFQYDFNDDETPIQDASIGYRGLDPFVFTIGNFKEPFGLNQLESDKTTTFVERALTDSLSPARNFGGAVGASVDTWTLAAGVFGGNINTGIEDDGVAGTGRLTYAPILTDDQVLHFGVAGSYRDLDTDRTPFSLSSRPENSLFSAPLVSTGMLSGADAVTRFGLEALYQYRSYRVQAEYAFADVRGIEGRGDRFFQSGYVEVAAVLNGNGRPYQLAPDSGAEYAVLGGVEVDDARRISRGGIGIFEVAARFSAIDLQDGPVAGGRQQDFTAGLNWYPDPNIKLMANYVHANADPAARSLLKGGDAYSDAFLGRVQISW